MASFHAELYIEEQVYPVLWCALEFRQQIQERGRVSARVRQGPLLLLLDVAQDDDTLVSWAATPHKKLSGHLIFFDTAQLSPHESIHFEEAECVGYQESFDVLQGENGSYTCSLTITAPEFALGTGATGGAAGLSSMLAAVTPALPSANLAAKALEVVESKVERYQKRLRLLQSGRSKLTDMDQLISAAGPATSSAAAPTSKSPLGRLGSLLGSGPSAAVAEAGPGPLPLVNDRNILQKAVDRLTFNNVAVERARLSQHAYQFTTTADPSGLLLPTFTEEVPEGWQALQVWDDKQTGFAAALYDSDFEQPNRKVLAFRGTNPTEWGDIKADLTQALGIPTKQYDQAIQLAQNLKQQYGGLDIVQDAGLDMTGHSLGGGLAAAASTVTGAKGYTFNAAGLHPRSVKPYGISKEAMRAAAPGLIDNVYSNRDPLNGLQNHMGGLIPKSVGTPHVLDKAGFHPIGAVVNAIEAEKDADTATIKHFTAQP
ncbi:type VI secretion system tube protein TssD [Hymenobacter chitinivorans]|uniref:Lipase (Class 3) n=1 Tax=Hymenobacter chitinivorans DSM 11115 TaxID=1121954 RepID=A0A2M9BN28_9BACT|nr:type VI secretion system tube protein TssD [Hymenobacter chitinivorans]PJJ59371.1 Protein of unknown function (DUF2974) [Hymenobacter chitinivorans DSM 11115]